MHRNRRITTVLARSLAVALTAGAGLAWACGPYEGDPFTPASPAHDALSADPALARPARQTLRASGPDGLAQLEAAHPDLLDALRTGEPASDPDLARRLSAAIDHVAGQKDGAFSRLYWHNDLDAARSAAAQTGRPILSLHLLGKLTDEHSCANSRFFRTVLYPDPAVNAFLRDHFVMHWQSVRSAPTLSVDLGDGRRVERTITGNSVHYVLDAGGRVLDGIPGLVTADAFVASLQQSLDRKSFMSMQRTEAIAHETWRTGLAAAADAHTAPGIPLAFAHHARPPAERAMALTVGKRLVESGPLNAVLMQEDLAVAPVTADVTPAPLSTPSRALMRLQNPALTKPDFDRMVNTFRQNLAVDTTRNLTQLQPRLRRLLAEHDAPPSLAAFNARVYDDVFSTPLDDPWMGLETPGTYTGLVNGGLHRPAEERTAAPPSPPVPPAPNLPALGTYRLPFPQTARPLDGC